jgi:DNA-nicking Smr family endonuclease
MQPVAPSPLDVGGQPAGVDAASWQRFRRGQLSSARKLDLHGMTAQQAHHALRGFLRAAHADRVRCVEVVTGRGNGEHGGVLRREFALWLNLPDIRQLVLAAVHPHTSSAMHSHAANPGSVRLLLRRPRG